MYSAAVCTLIFHVSETLVARFRVALPSDARSILTHDATCLGHGRMGSAAVIASLVVSWLVQLGHLIRVGQTLVSTWLTTKAIVSGARRNPYDERFRCGPGVRRIFAA